MKQFTIKNKIINLDEVISLLGVSSATIRNWIKYNYLTPQGNGTHFYYDEVKKLKKKIITGQLNRLNKRANKRHSQNTFIPDEYIDKPDVLDAIRTIINNSKSYDYDFVLFSVIAKLLNNKKLISYKQNFEDIKFKNDFIRKEFNWWQKKIGKHRKNKLPKVLDDLEIPKVNDILGIIYQSLSLEGSKAQAGSYYTPKYIVDEIIDNYITSQSKLLDPCCGTGQFLLSASEKIKKPSNIWGFDIDEIAVRIARINLLLRYSDVDFHPNIFINNTLLDFNNDLFTKSDIPKFDVVATNPPWGVHLSKNDTATLKKAYPTIKSNESFSYFIKKGMDFLRDEGTLSYILPEAILNVKTHRDIREIILEQTKIEKIQYLNRVFKNVFTPVIRLDITRKHPLKEDVLISEKDGIKHSVNQFRLRKNIDYLFDVFNNDEDIRIFEKIYKTKHLTLQNNADWALGIVTGNNKEYVLNKKEKGTETILTGKDIKRFAIKEPKTFIKFRPKKFQQVADENKYRVEEKLVYKFISKELIFAYDDKKTLTLNSANILIPKLNNYHIKTILALFNSSLYQFLYQKKYNSIKILRGNLEKLPLPVLSGFQNKSIEVIVNRLIETNNSNEDRKLLYDKLDKIIMYMFNLSKKEIQYIISNIKLSSKSLKVE